MLSVVFLTILGLLGWTDDFSSTTSSTTAWQGDWSRFTINANEVLQSHADSSAVSCLMRPSTASLNAEWSYYTRIYGGTSAYNLTRFYILTADSLTADGYYIQVGGSKDNISLWRVRNGTREPIIESTERQQILPQTDAEVYVRLTRDENGVFHLYSLVENTDVDYVEEGTYRVSLLSAQAVALYVANSSKRGYDMYFDDIRVEGEEQTEALEQESKDIQLEINTDYLSLNQQPQNVTIAYTCTESTYKANLYVYSDDGRLMRTCCRQLPLDASGTLIWNGDNDHNEKVEIGVYVLILEITSPAHAPVRKRYPIAVLH